MEKLQIVVEVDSKTGQARITDLGQSIRESADKARKAMSDTERGSVSAGKGFQTFAAVSAQSVKSLYNQVFSLQSLLAGLGAGMVARSFLKTAEGFESLETQLVTLTGSSERARASMRWIADFTSKTPFELEQVSAAFAKLMSYGIEPTNGSLKTLGNLAAGMNKSLDQAVEAFADAATGEFERLKEFGIRASQEGDRVTFSWMQNGQQMVRETEKNQVSITNTLVGILEGRFAGSMDRFQTTWKGMWSNAMDLITEFKQKVMESGVFDVLKAGLSETLKGIDKLKKDGKLDEWAADMADDFLDAISAMLFGVQTLADSISGIRASFGFLAEHGFGTWATIKDNTRWMQPKAEQESFGKDIKMFQELSEAGRLMKEGAFDDIRKFDELIDKIERKKVEIANKVKETLKQRAAEAEYDALLDFYGGGSTSGAVSGAASGTSSTAADTTTAKKAADERLRIARHVTDEIKRLTLSEYEYNKWALDQEVADLSVKAAGDKTITGQITEYKKEKLEEIEEEHQKSLERQVEEEKKAAEEIKQLKADLTDAVNQMTMGEFEYRQWALDQEIEALKDQAAGKQEILEQIGQYQILRQAEIDMERQEATFASEHQVMDALRESWGLTWDEMRSGHVDVWADIASASAAASHDLANGFIAVASGSKSAKAAAGDMLRSIAAQAINTLIQIGVQKLILAATEKTVLATTTAAMVASMQIIEANAAAAAMMVSIATYGSASAVGAAAFTAAMGTMTAAYGATKATLAGISAGTGATAATGAVFDRPTLTIFGEDGPEAVVPLSPQRSSERDAILNRIAPSGSGESVINVDIGGIHFHGDVKLDAGMDQIKTQIGNAVKDAIRGAK